MFISEDGTVTGSIDVSRLDQLNPKSDEAKAQVEALKREHQQGQEQAARDAERASQGERALGINSTGRNDDDEDGDSRTSQAEQQQDAVRQQSQAQQGDEAKQAEDTTRLQAEAEQAGVTVDKRWGADRLRQEIDAAKAAQARKR